VRIVREMAGIMGETALFVGEKARRFCERVQFSSERIEDPELGGEAKAASVQLGSVQLTATSRHLH